MTRGYRAQVRKQRDRLQKRLDDKETKPTRFKAVMGDGAGNVIVETTPNYVFVRHSGRGRVDRVLCTRVSPRNNLPVIVGYSLERPDEMQVLEVDWMEMEEYGGYYSYMPRHHFQHELLNEYGGDDVVWVRTQQFMYLLVQVTDPVSEYLDVQSGVYKYYGEICIYSGGQTGDITAYAPGAGAAIMLLISLNAASGTLSYTESEEFSMGIPASFRIQRIPDAPEGHIPLAAVYCPNGMTEVDWNVLYDLRTFLGTIDSEGPHALLGSMHYDTFPTTPAHGDMIVAGGGAGGNVWGTLNAGGDYRILTINPATDLPAWQKFDWDNQIIAAGGDGVHNHTTNGEGGPLLCNTTYVTGTEGSVLFITSITGQTRLGQDNPVFFFDRSPPALGVGTDSPNVMGERSAVTIRSDDMGAPTLELYRYDDFMMAGDVLGTVRWLSGGVEFPFTPCVGGQIDVVQTGWYDTESTMRFWVADGCALCLGMELSCDGLYVVDSLGIGVAPPGDSHLYIYNDAVDTTSTYYGLRNYHVKTAGASGVDAHLYGIRNDTWLNQAGGTIGNLYGIYNPVGLTDGNIGDAVTGRAMRGMWTTLDLDGGKVWGSVLALQVNVDQEAANEITENIYGCYVQVDADGTVGGTVYMLYLQEYSNIDYGIYQNGSAPNVFGGTIAATHGDHWALEDYHAGAPTADGYVRVDINGVTYQLLANIP